jgi:signal transduction histidine kinase
LEITVSDTGIGMPPQTISTLFKIGETTSRQGTQGERGSGFGLLLTKEFIEKQVE